MTYRFVFVLVTFNLLYIPQLSRMYSKYGRGWRGRDWELGPRVQRWILIRGPIPNNLKITRGG
jgi:hypothetical protein